MGRLQRPHRVLVHVAGGARPAPHGARCTRRPGWSTPGPARPSHRTAWCRPSTPPLRPRGRRGSRNSAGSGRGPPRRPGSAAGRPPATSRRPRRSADRAGLSPAARTEGTLPTSIMSSKCCSRPGGPTTCSVRPPPISAVASRKNGHPKQWSAWKCEMTTTSTSSTGNRTAPQVGQRGGAGLDQDRGVHDEAVPVATRRGEEVARPQKGQLGHRVSANERKAATSMGSPTTAESGTGRRR